MTRTDISPNRTWLNGLCILKRQDTTPRKKTDEQWCKSDRYKRKTWFMPNSEQSAPWYSINYIIPALNCKPKRKHSPGEMLRHDKKWPPKTQISPVLPKAVPAFLLPLITTFWFKTKLSGKDFKAFSRESPLGHRCKLYSWNLTLPIASTQDNLQPTGLLQAKDNTEIHGNHSETPMLFFCAVSHKYPVPRICLTCATWSFQSLKRPQEILSLLVTQGWRVKLENT